MICLMARSRDGELASEGPLALTEEGDEAGGCI